MKKFNFYLVLLLIIGFNAFASDNIINSIKIEGTQRVDTETVVSYSETSIGDFFSILDNE